MRMISFIIAAAFTLTLLSGCSQSETPQTTGPAPENSAKDQKLEKKSRTPAPPK
jgi:PBP1b-binding outer membrane lipoprotein LpoB